MDQNIDQILVLAPRSLIGSRFVEMLFPKTIIYGAGHASLSIPKQYLKSFTVCDFTNRQEVFDLIKNYHGKYLINFAASTNVNQIEKTRPPNPEDQELLNQNEAYKINCQSVKYIVDASKQYNKFPIFISTETVFDGLKGPYSESDSVAASSDLVSWYAWTKILAEREISNSQIPHLIIRLSYPYRKEFEYKTDFARNFLNLYDQYKKNQIAQIYPIFTDQKITLTFIDNLVPVIEILVKKNVTGIFHISSVHTTTPYEYILELFRKAQNVSHPERIVPKGSIVDFQRDNPSIAKRPIRSGLKSDKIIKLGFVPTEWKDGIKIAYSMPSQIQHKL